MSFSNGFEKTAFIGPAIGALARGVGAVGSGLLRAGGAVAKPLASGAAKAGGSILRGAARTVGGSTGPMGYLGLGLTAQQAASDYSKNKSIMNSAMQR